MTKQISKAQLTALRVYAEYIRTSDSGTTHRPGAVRLDTHCALLKRGLLEVADLRPPRTVQHTYGYNFGRIRITKSHIECDSRFRLTDAGRELLAAAEAPKS